MKALVFCDAHENPDCVSSNLRTVIGIAENNGWELYSVGDLLNLLPLGRDGWEGWLRQFDTHLDDYPITLVAGNHDPYRWLKKMFADWENVRVVRRCDIEGYHLRHGHSWSPDWWVLRHIAPGLVDFMLDAAPKQWHWFSRKMGWIPSELKAQGGPKEHQYHKQIKYLLDESIKYAEKHNTTVLYGHTHCQMAAPGRPSRLFSVDGGTLKEGDYLIIDGDRVKRCNLVTGVCE